MISLFSKIVVVLEEYRSNYKLKSFNFYFLLKIQSLVSFLENINQGDDIREQSGGFTRVILPATLKREAVHIVVTTANKYPATDHHWWRENVCLQLHPRDFSYFWVMWISAENGGSHTKDMNSSRAWAYSHQPGKYMETEGGDSHQCMQMLWSGPQYCLPTQDTQIPEINSKTKVLTHGTEVLRRVPQKQLILMNVPINVLAVIKLNLIYLYSTDFATDSSISLVHPQAVNSKRVYSF